MLQELLLLLLMVLWRLATVSWRKNLFIIEHLYVCVWVSFLFLFVVVVVHFFFIHVGTTRRKWCALAATKVHHARFIVTYRSQWQQTNRWCSTNGQNNDTTTKNTVWCKLTEENSCNGSRNSDLFVRACICADLRTRRHTLTLPRIFSLSFSRECESNEEE